MAKLAILSPDSCVRPDRARNPLAMFLQAMEKLGYVEGRNIWTEFRFAEDRLDRLPALAAELAAWRPDVIYTYTSGGARAAANATKSIPIVVGPAAETVLLALAGNLAHPTGNVTGLTLQGLGQDEKCLQLLKELAPGASRIGVLLNPDNPAWADYPEILNPAASRLGLALVRVVSRGLADIDQVLAGARRRKLDGLYLLADLTFSPGGLSGGRLIEFARERHASASTPYSAMRSVVAFWRLAQIREYLRRRSADVCSTESSRARGPVICRSSGRRNHLSVNLITAKAIR